MSESQSKKIELDRKSSRAIFSSKSQHISKTLKCELWLLINVCSVAKLISDSTAMRNILYLRSPV